jgi:Fur family peroxide stress response transcriptional regulator
MNKVDRLAVGRRLDRFRSAVRAAGVKLTHQRLEIFREVASSLDHPDAESVLRGVRRRIPAVSIDTVYRTLWMLNELGLITTLGPRRDSVRFDANLERHHHFVCVRCGLTRDFDSAELGALRVPTSIRELGRVTATQVEVQGVCRRCAAIGHGTVKPRKTSQGHVQGGIEHGRSSVDAHDTRRRTGANAPVNGL